ncbi:MAG: ABC transporter permease [Saprospirales bacterium]|nr:ABC transporter permease [Saprospirales bacterium]
MIQNYIKIALRNIFRHRLFSLINIFGLALAIGICLLIILLVKDAYSYDKFHPEGERVYRLLTHADRKAGRSESYASSPFIMAQTLLEQMPQAEAWCPLVRTFNGELRLEGKAFDFGGMFAGPAFFDLFGFELAEGDPASALTEPNSIVLTDEMATRISKDTSPLGMVLEVGGYETPFRVTGVLKPFAGKTHLDFMALGSLSTQLALERMPDAYNITANWQNYYMTYNFLRLKSRADKEAVEAALNRIASAQYAGLELESRDAGYRFSLQPLAKITPGAQLSNTIGSGMPLFLIWFLAALGVILILSASFNYTNLTIARSFQRTKEVGVRKVLGATRGQVFGQFISEAVVMSLFALLLAYPIMKFARYEFEQLSIATSMDMRLEEDWQLYVLFLLFTLVVGFSAGLLPALALSRIRPAAILQKLQNTKLLQRIGLRKALITVQFTITLILLITMTIAWKQSTHAISVNFGFDKPSILVVELQGQPFEKAAAALGQVRGVENLSGISFPMGTWRDGSSDVRTESNAERTGVRDYDIDHRYLDQFGIELVAGENFPDNPAQQGELFAIVNETFVSQFNLGQASEAIGRPLILGDSTNVVIRGVVKDFPYKPAVYAMEPLLLRYNPAQWGVLNLGLSVGDTPATLAALENAWEKLAPDDPFQAQFFDQLVRENYDEPMDLVRVVLFFGILGMVIASLGLLGMVTYAVETRAREISIRKVMGASAVQIVLMLSKAYLLLFCIAAAIAIPVSFLLGNQMLQFFSDRISWSAGLFLPGVLLLMAVAALTVCSQTIRAALANPVESLRSE